MNQSIILSFPLEKYDLYHTLLVVVFFSAFLLRQDILMKKISIIAGIGLVILTVTTNLSCNDKKVAHLPAIDLTNYNAMKACDKQQILWDKIIQNKYEQLPEFKKFGVIQLIAMGRQELNIKTENFSDIAPEGWVKYLHRHGSVAKVKIVPLQSKFSGVFAGAECALLRLSLTYKPAGSKPVAPGLALKVLRDGIHSGNISALVSLEGQEKNYNFFEHPMSNIVPPSDGFGQKLVHKLFAKVSAYPEELRTEDLANFSSDGKKENKAIFPRQLFFVADPSLKFATDEHDIREDFHKIPSGTVIYRIYARNSGEENFKFNEMTKEQHEKFQTEATPIAEVVTTSEFVSSTFGDDHLFFRHQWHKKGSSY